MAKQTPQLTLVKGRTPGAAERGAKADTSFQIIALSELSARDAAAVQKTVSQVIPGAAIIGIQVSSRAWDLRPVVVVGSEAGPSLIRFFGPEVRTSNKFTARARETFERLTADHELRSFSKTVQWGFYDEEVWCRRFVVDSTLHELIVSGKRFSLPEAFSISCELVSALEALHDRGIVHGHITLSNVSVHENAEVSLLDAGVGLTIVQAWRTLGNEGFPPGYKQGTFAPETLEGDSAVFSSDIFGVGLVLKYIFSHLEQHADADDTRKLEIRDVIPTMIDNNPARRPSLTELKTLLRGMPTTASARRPTLETKVEEELTKSGEPRKGQLISDSSELGRKITIRTRTKKPQQAPANHHEPSQPTNVQGAEVEPTRHEEQPVAAMRADSPLKLQLTEFLQTTLRLAEGIIRTLIFYISKYPRQVTFAGGALAVILFAVIIVQGFDSSESPEVAEKLELAWYSQRPSMMTDVAKRALDVNRPSQVAQTLIISSALKGELVSQVIDVPLIRVAFDARWEAELNEEDRRFALTMALSGLLGDETPTDLAALETIHPGVLLAVISSAPDSASNFFSQLPAIVLSKLPPPIGPAFYELAQASPELDCGDSSVRVLARLATNGLYDSVTAIKFIAEEPQSRIRVVAHLFSQDNTSARQLISMLINKPKLKVKDELISWAQSWKLLEWEGVEPSDRLFVLAGIPPSVDIGLASLGKLFSHPMPSMRAYSIKKVRQTVEFKHPASAELLPLLEKNPELLTPNQTIYLAQMLQNPAKVARESIAEWLKSDPPIDMVSKLLVSTSAEKSGTALDFELSRYLQSKKWQPGVKELRELSVHPERLTRLYAYTRIFALEDKRSALLILKSAEKSEKNDEYKKQLQRMIKALDK